MTENIIIAKNYDKIDGKNAYRSEIKQLTIGLPTLKENQELGMVFQIWQETEKGTLEVKQEIPVHQLLDGVILFLRTLQHFGEAYRFPNFYDEKNPTIDRIGLQGGVMPIEVDTENPKINQGMKELSQLFSDSGELTGERLRTVTRILEELGYV